ncbi:hypothetical protein Ancab_035314 [Ancistrocladus abbreviatus]
MTMRFKKGGKVEVFSQKEVPSGSWRCAEIICGNGHYYTVKFERDIGACGEATFERVPRRAIRPCPPLIKVLESWLPGDIVEVFHYFSWKMVTILKTSDGGLFSVRLLGSSQELEVSQYDLRVRVCWQDNEWVVIGKGSNDSQDLRKNLISTLRSDQSSGQMETVVRQHLNNDHLATKKINSIQEFQAAPSRTLKRKFPFLEKEAYAGCSQKLRLNEKESRRLQFISMPRSSLPEKVDAVASSRKRLDEKCMHPSFNNRITGCSEMFLGWEIRDGAVGCTRAIRLESSDADSVSSSVGSCSVSRNYPCMQPHAFSTGPFEESDNSQCSDAESCCRSGFEEGNCLLPSAMKLTDEIRRLELHAYRCTMEALHASGPLSWEQESLLTNLRDSLHISNDEHLMELRNLVSNSTCIPTS